MRELRIGDRVGTAFGALVVVDLTAETVSAATREEVDSLYRHGAAYIHHIPRAEVEPLPPDIPRERVADLHAAVMKRMGQLSGFPYAEAFARRELSEVAEALRLMLGGES